MALQRIWLTVYLDAGDDKDPTEHVVEVKHKDRLDAEIKGPAMGLPPLAHIESAPTLFSTFWAWLALTREGLYGGKWAQFRDSDCVGVEDYEPEAENRDVDPTQTAGSTTSP